MRLVFAGTPEFAAIALRALLDRGYDVVSILTQPDRPSGRGLRESYSPVKQLASKRGIAVRQPVSLRDPGVQAGLGDLDADAWVVAAYGLLLPRAVLELPRFGCVNIHASLLPRWRGAAPIQRAVLAGDTETGVSIMRMDAGLDTGPVYLRRGVPIEAHDTAGSLHDCLAEVGAAAVCEVLDALAAGAIRAEAQATEGACYAPKLTREDAHIDWSQPAVDLERRLRALDPVPGAYTTHAGAVLKMWSGRVSTGRAAAVPGTLLAAGPAGIEIQCGDGSLIVTVLQRAGSRRLEAGPFLLGHRIEPGTRLGD
ncbi:MAG: methionyl-tRNA formyltransferase [Betaproteobacteria bacterium]|nr:methionyl-tRNA formyltransferase [Betaproteobacteria bacterium]